MQLEFEFNKHLTYKLLAHSSRKYGLKEIRTIDLAIDSSGDVIRPTVV